MSADERPPDDDAERWAEQLRADAAAGFGAGAEAHYTREDVLRILKHATDEYAARMAMRREPSTTADNALVPFTRRELLQPLPLEHDLIAGMIPTESYTVIAGALSSAKTTLLHLLHLSRVSGCDLLNLQAHIEVGPCVLVSYEDSDARIRRRLLTCIQWAHTRIRAVHGKRAARHFLALVLKNLRRVTLTGKPGAALVCRDIHGNAAPNGEQIESMLARIAAFATRELMIGIDPLRLAFRGAQNDDDGADVTVAVLNMLAGSYPDSALVVPSHTTKQGAIEPGTDRASQAYATSGSALYSQHARSNFYLARPKPDEVRKLVHPDHVTEAEIAGQRITVLSHARLSHGIERGALYYAMRKGVLESVPAADSSETQFDRTRRLMPAIIEAILRTTAKGGNVSQVGLEEDPTLRRLVGRADLRRAIKDAMTQGWIESTGSTSDRALIVTDKGRQLSPARPAREGRE